MTYREYMIMVHKVATMHHEIAFDCVNDVIAHIYWIDGLLTTALFFQKTWFAMDQKRQKPYHDSVQSRA